MKLQRKVILIIIMTLIEHRVTKEKKKRRGEVKERGKREKRGNAKKVISDEDN